MSVARVESAISGLFLLALCLVVPPASSRPLIRSSIDGGDWLDDRAIYPIAGQRVVLAVEEVPGAVVRWFQIVPDISRVYKNANFPWESDPYQWLGEARIGYCRRELTQLRGQWEIEPLVRTGLLRRSSLAYCGCDAGERAESSSELGPTGWSPRSIRSRLSRWIRPPARRFYHDDIGTFWIQVEIDDGGAIGRSPGLEGEDGERLSPSTYRISVREGEGYVGFLSSFYNVPGVFGSTSRQSRNHIGVDCADAIVAAYEIWAQDDLVGEYNVARLVDELDHVARFDLSSEGELSVELAWHHDIYPGDLLAVRHTGHAQFIHVGALYEDGNRNGYLDGDDLVLHAGPWPLHLSRIKGSAFRGQAVVLRF